MKILLINYGVAQKEYVAELFTDLQAQGYEVENRENLISGITSIYTNDYIAVVLVMKAKRSNCDTLIDFLKYVKEETQLKVVVISTEEDAMKLQGDVFLPYGVKGSFVVKNLKEGIQKGKKQVLIEFNEKLEYNLTRTELMILKALMKNPNKTVGREEILKTIGHESNNQNERIVDVHIKSIREKIEIDNILTVRGIGYKWVE